MKRLKPVLMFSAALLILSASAFAGNESKKAPEAGVAPAPTPCEIDAQRAVSGKGDDTGTNKPAGAVAPGAQAQAPAPGHT